MSFPREVLEQAEARRLGDPVRAFDARTGRRRALAWMVLLGLAGVWLVPAAVIYLAEGDLWLGIPAAILALAYLGGVAWILWRAVSRGALHGGRLTGVYLFSYGLVVVGGGDDPQGGAGRTGAYAAYRWDDLAAVTTSGVQRVAHGPTYWQFTITAADGRQIILGDELPAVRELGEAVVAEVTARIVPQALSVVQAGDVVRLGPFAISLEGIEKEGERVAWPAVREVGIDNGIVFVRTLDGLLPLASVAARTPNAVAFVELCHHLQALQAADGVSASGVSAFGAPAVSGDEKSIPPSRHLSFPCEDRH
ncbi:DUF6585 family protein [Actinomadura rudentiformis]|uniref:Uncharacterized protein n=1 Tax=Actinomadura rudentiformis TaxID=359158 RepID=A0A6H9YMI4_9ACTN|nr:DUF6585 family protein [Actinomadura rudentiformis]KAB2347952.1 hypothetical protein F8566_18910 [Actinomadura rudentiformis]